jgi:glycine C-acetyltransferase/8-amino-7-oxononanoate synthase
MFSTAPPPPVVAGALAALGLLEDKPRLVERLEANAATLRAGLEREGFAIRGLPTERAPIIALPVGDAAIAARVCQAALERGVFGQAVTPPAVPAVSSAVRLTVMASHRHGELEAAARTFGQAARAAGFDPGARIAPISDALERAPDEQGLETRGVFDFDARAA